MGRSKSRGDANIERLTPSTEFESWAASLLQQADEFAAAAACSADIFAQVCACAYCGARAHPWLEYTLALAEFDERAAMLPTMSKCVHVCVCACVCCALAGRGSAAREARRAEYGGL